MKLNNLIDEQSFFYLSTLNDKKKPTIYISEKYRLTEIDVLTLIKICVNEKRNLRLGYKILEVYKDATNGKGKEKLKLIGIKDDTDNNQPTTPKEYNNK